MAPRTSDLVQALRDLLVENRQVSGRAWLENVVVRLSQVFSGAFVQVGQLSADESSIRSDPCAQEGELLEAVQYDLEGTPCAHVVGAQTAHFPRAVAEHFPQDHYLKEHGFVSYLGSPMFSADGQPSGLLSILSREPLDLDVAAMTIFEALALRTGADVERAAALRARAKSEALFKQVVNHQTEMVCRFSTDGRLTFANRSYLETFGLSPAVVGSKPYREFVHPGDMPSVQEQLAKITVDNPRIVIENRIFDARDRIRWTQWTNLGLFDEEGELVAYQAAGRDITEQKDSEERLRQAHQDLQEAHEQKDRFLAMLAHELRNPLAAILNALSLLELRVQGAGDTPALAIAKRQALNQARLLDDLLDLSRITRGKIELRRTPLHFFDIVREVAEARQDVCQKKSQTLSIALPGEDLFIDADRVRIEQVVSNLLENACKYTPSGGAIRIEGALEDNAAVLRVTDTGRGIPPESISKVFDMFQQGSEEGSSGLGIGLTVVRELVELHGGEVTAESRGVGAGSTFTVRFPLVEGTRIPQAGHPQQPTEEARRRIVVVDDNTDAAEMLGELLRAWGHEVTTAHDARRAIEAIHAEHPDVALIDISMPGTDGYEVARELRASYSSSHLRLVAVTGFGQPSDVRRAREAGFDGHLTKPASHADLRKFINSLE